MRIESVTAHAFGPLTNVTLDLAPGMTVITGVNESAIQVAGEENHMPAILPYLNSDSVPVLRQVVLDTTDVRALAEFYRRLLDLQYRPGDEHPGADVPDPRGQDWLVLRRLDGSTALAFQKVEQLPPATWPNGPHPQMLHLDLTVPNRAELDAAHQRALALGARVLMDRSDDAEEPLWVYADPAGHPFCIFVVPAAGG